MMKCSRIIFAALLVALGIVAHVSASATLGTIDPNNVGNRNALLVNTSLGADTTINFGDFDNGQSASNITVSNTELRGFAWGEMVGWIVVNCADATSGCSGTNGNFKVANDGSGNLSGYAWGENAGWINFGPFSDPDVSTVKITNGLFGGTLGDAGYAWSQNFGWITFDCSDSDSCVETDWGVDGGDDTDYGYITPQCRDGLDNADSEDLLADSADPGCHTDGNAANAASYDPNDTSEYNTVTPPSYCLTNPNALGCREYRFCDYYPTHPRCVPRPPFCTTNPTHPSCTNGGGPINCTTNPTDPSCVVIDFCTANPTHVSCIGDGGVDCDVNPDDTRCLVDVCTVSPTHPLCIGGGDPNCTIYPNDPRCTGTDVCVTNPASCTPPPDICETDPASCVPPPSLCETNPQLCINPDEDPGGGQGCATNPSTCAPSPDVCVTNPQLCAVTPTFCAQYPERCLAPEAPSLFSIPIFSDPLIKIVTALGVGLPIFSTIISYLIGNPLTFADIPLMASNGWSSFLVAMGWKKKKKPWGIVYDSVTKRPIDPAYVVLTDTTGNEIATAITDINGRYGFAVDPGTYKMMANKTNYVFPSVKLAGKDHDDLYEDLYFGGDVVVSKEGEIITKNIPLDQIAFDWNEYAKAENNTHGQRLRFYRKSDIFIYRLSRFIFVLGFAFSIYAILFYPTLYNAIVFGLYVVMTIVRAFTPVFHQRGSVRSKYDDEPHPYSIVRIISTVTNKEVGHKVADRIGNYYGLVQNGKYKIVVDTKVDEHTYDKHPIPDSFDIKKGYLKEKFKV